MNIKKSLLVGSGMVVCALVGAGFEHVKMLGMSSEAEVKPIASGVKVAPRHDTQVRDAELKKTMRALQKRVAELEKALAESSAKSAPVEVTEQPTDNPPVQETRPKQQSMAQRMEQFKQEHPEQYAEMQKRREEFRQRREQQVNDRVDFLSAVDVKNMTNEQKENHAQLLATVDRINTLMAKREEPGVERTHEMMHEIGKEVGKLNELYRGERTYLLGEVAKSVGYSGADMAAFTEHIQMVIDNTTVMPIGGRHGGAHSGTPAQ